MAYTKYSLTPANNNAAPPDGAPEGMLPSAVNDTMRDMMAQIRDVGDGIRGGTYTMTAPVITGGSITGVALSGNTLTNPVITGGSINNTTVGATTRSTGAFTTLASNGATTFTAGTASTSTTTGTAVITGGLGVSGRINAANFDGIVGANTAAAGNFTTLGATGVATFSAGTVSAPAITTTGDTNTGIFFPAADTIAFTEGGAESMRIDSSGNVGIGTSSPNRQLSLTASSEINSSSTVYHYFGPNGTNLQGFIGYNGNGDTDIGARSGYGISFKTVSSGAVAETMRLTASGNLGIGTSSPVTRLHVLDDLSGGQFVVSNSQTNSALKYGTFATQHYTNAEEPALCIAIEAASTENNVLIGGALGEFNAATGIKFYTAANNTTTAGTERMRIDSSGNLLVGTTSADAKLYVLSTGAGVAKFRGGAAGSDNCQIKLAGTQTGDLFLVGTNCSTNGTGANFEIYDLVASASRFNINSSGNVKLEKNISVGNATPTTSGTGITFPATQSASSDANTLDDYEEGTFTPTYYGDATAGTTTYSFQNGYYTKIGNIVNVIINIGVTNATGTGNALIGGLPFSSANSTNNYASATIRNDGLAQGGGQLQSYVDLNNTVISLGSANLTTGANSNIAIDTSVNRMMISATYRTA